MIRIREAIVVEGRYDKNVLSQIVDAPIFETSGFGIMNDRVQLELLRRVARQRGLIVFTDADGAGFVIRNYLKSAIPGEYLKHAYTPEIPGKERRKSTSGKAGILGVEGMRPEIIIEALRRAGATIEGESAREGTKPMTKAEMFALGLSGRPDSASRRAWVQQRMGLPARMTANGLLEALNVFTTREELRLILAELERGQ